MGSYTTSHGIKAQISFVLNSSFVANTMGIRHHFLVTLSLIALSNACFGQRYSWSNRQQQKNIYGQPLQICSLNPRTGWFRDGYARTDGNDRGLHVVCATMTREFLEYTKRMGNDLSTPRPWFPGLKPGDKWALCAVRWYQAYRAGKAPYVNLNSTNKKALTVVPLNILEEFDDSQYTP